jgi:hypothetical protein
MTDGRHGRFVSIAAKWRTMLRMDKGYDLAAFSRWSRPVPNCVACPALAVSGLLMQTASFCQLFVETCNIIWEVETHRIFHLLLPQDQRAALVQWLSHRFGTDNVRVEPNWTYVDVREEPLKALRELLQVSGCSTCDVLIKDLTGFNMVLRLEGRITRYYDFCVQFIRSY